MYNTKIITTMVSLTWLGGFPDLIFHDSQSNLGNYITDRKIDKPKYMLNNPFLHCKEQSMIRVVLIWLSMYTPFSPNNELKIKHQDNTYLETDSLWHILSSFTTPTTLYYLKILILLDINEF